VERSHFKLVVRTLSPKVVTLSLEDVPPEQTVAELIRHVLSRLGMPSGQQGWCLDYRGSSLRPEARLCHYFLATKQPVELVLRRVDRVAALRWQPWGILPGDTSTRD
jgi:hypothetical protein